MRLTLDVCTCCGCLIDREEEPHICPAKLSNRLDDLENVVMTSPLFQQVYDTKLAELRQRVDDLEKGPWNAAIDKAFDTLVFSNADPRIIDVVRKLKK